MADLFAPFRARELAFRANAVALLRDPDAVRVALSWRSVPVAWKFPDSAPPADEAGIWRWIWTEVDADEADLARASGVAPADVRYWLRVLIANRLIYPDGTIADVVDELANRQVAEATLPKGLG